jgi:N-acetylglucosaminyldiphosphoundecaprenol N-acetyl-beta-D-mannosaminyltransferase
MQSVVPIFDIPVVAASMPEVLDTIGDWIACRGRHYICTLDVHALVESTKSPDVRRIYQNAAMVTPDGMPLVWFLHRKGYSQANRICGPDLMPALFDLSQTRGYKHFLYGSSERTIRLMRQSIEVRWPGARVVGSFSPPFRPLTPTEIDTVNALINAAEPDIVWVGLGAPKQDRWMAAHRPSLAAPALIGVGAAFDMLAGVVRRAPSFVQRSGCEWMFRLTQEPQRLWKRYLSANSQFALLVLAQELHLQKHRYGG